MRKVFGILMLLALFITTGMNAQEDTKNDFKKWQVRFRAAAVIPDVDSKVGVIGGDVDISTQIIPEVDFTYYFTKNIAAELILGTTQHNVEDLSADLSALGINTPTDVDLGSVWLLPPTLNLQYHFYPTENFKPYVGAGINYTIFYGIDEGNAVADVEYDNAVGYSFQLGFDYKITDCWFFNVDAKKMFLKTDVTVDASNLLDGLSIPAEVEINPWIVGAGFGFKF
ncbi:OmpW/AlkL family protein [Aureivirga sp. CE67]|uniref:OmpW/AlkL family protein n=1 Tax=Aureivirga sp. CE67 TaxID=1788983 RepID=UPI0018C8D8ED|nr:OmpW family outer membrane protein [Aureivirga sp. CE67]